jgi:hypothetical protein
MKRFINITLIVVVVLTSLFFIKPNVSEVSALNHNQVFLPLVIRSETTTLPNNPIVQSTAAPPVPTPKPVEVTGDSFYVQPNGSPSGDGSVNNPWDLQTALNHPSSVKPGDTIWLRGGDYVGQFVSHLKGDVNKPITVRQFPGERAILESTGLVIDIQDTVYVDFWGFEIASNDNPRDPDTRPLWGFGVRVHQGEVSHHIRFINMIIRDMPAQGFGWWIANTDAEIYGSLIYHNGVTELDHGIYTKNQTGTKRIEDNFIFDNASHGIHAYSSTDDTLNNFVMEGNTIFNNGSIGYNTVNHNYGTFKRNILLGGYVRVNNSTIKDNYTYYPGTSGQSLNLGYNAGSSNVNVQGNYLMGGQVQLGGSYSGLNMQNNTIYASSLLGFTASQFPNNTYNSSKPTGVKIFVQPNKFEINRANVTVYNWDKNTTVNLSAADLAGFSIPNGAHYELRNVQDYFGDVITGVYNGSSISIPMTNHSVEQPLGLSFKPATTFPEFGGFVLTYTNP